MTTLRLHQKADTVFQTLPVSYTPEELESFGRELAESVRELDAAEQQKKDEAAAWRERLESIHAQISDLAARIREKRRLAQVSCTVYTFLDSGEVVTLRDDTGEEVARRVLTPEERQTELPL